MRRSLPPGEPRPQRLHRLYAAARLRERHAGLPPCARGVRAADGRHHGIRVRVDGDGRAGMASTASTSPTIGDPNRDDDLAGPLAELFKPRYHGSSTRAHELGLHVWFHCCGNFAESSQISTNRRRCLNISNRMSLTSRRRPIAAGQTMLHGAYQLSNRLHQGSVDEILAEAQRMYELLATPAGGFIGYVEEYGCMGMSQENYRPAATPSDACAECASAKGG